jgi:hypothetical protein
VKWLFRTLLLAIIASPLVLFTGAVEKTPRVEVGEPVGVEDVARLKLLAQHNDPRDLRAGERRKVEVTGRDINLAIDYLLSRLPFATSLRAQSTLHEGRAELAATLPLENLPITGFINLTARLVPADQGVRIESINVGRWPVPQWAWQSLLDRLQPRLDGLDGYREFRDLLAAASAVTITDDRLAMTLTWQGDLAQRIEERGRALVLPAAERDRVVDHLNALAAALEGRGGTASLATILAPAFAHAAVRSEIGGDAAVENRAALLALALYVAADADDRRSLLGDEAAGRVQALPKVRLLLSQRRDLAQHFLVSAAVSVASNSAFADVIGVFKEVQDSQGGSGFSFADLAADRAGIRFAEAAIADPRGWQQRAIAVNSEQAFMPAVDALPEGMQEPAFVARFESRDSEAYAQVSDEIDARLARCAMYQ